MKKWSVLLVLILFCSTMVFAQQKAPSIAELKLQIKKLQTEINQMKEKKASKKKIGEKEDKRDSLIRQQAKLEKNKLQKQRALANKKNELQTAEAFSENFSSEAVEETGITIEARRVPLFRGELGATMGMFAAATGLFGELRFPLNSTIGPAATGCRLAGGYVQSADAGRKYVTVQGDGILNFPAGWLTGVDNYLGAGINYVVLTSGRVPGTIGGEIFYGVEGDGFGGKLFGELGYGVLRTGFSSSHKGTTVLFGYRSPWQIF
jgi:hypothetical protein